MHDLMTAPLTMTSREIADLTGKEHRNVMLDARKMLAELHGEGGLLSFEHTQVDPQNGQEYPVLRLLCFEASHCDHGKHRATFQTRPHRRRVWKPEAPLRHKPQAPHTHCGFFVRAPIFGGSAGGLRPCRFPQGVPGLPTRSSRRHGLEASASVFGNRTTWRPTMARLIRRDFRPGSASLTDLPFVANVKVAPRKKRRNYWNVPQTDDYVGACAVGQQYACDFLQYIKDNASSVGSNIIGLLVKDMEALRGTAMKGYEVGFWFTLEMVLYRAVNREDHWRIVQGIRDHFDAKAREIEESEEARKGAEAKAASPSRPTPLVRTPEPITSRLPS